MPFSITGIILAKNEKEHITECIKSISFCDEILVIDDCSSDETIDLINNLNNKKVIIISHVLNDDFSQARNFGLEKAHHEWVLFIDADERVSEALAFEISNVLSNCANEMKNAYSGFYISRLDSMWGKELKYGESAVKLLRLAKKNAGVWVGRVHEEWRIEGKVGMLKNSITHYPHQTVAEFLREINFYTSVRAQELYEKNIRTSWWSIIFYPMSKFIVNYFFKKGFFDGIHGLIFAIIMSFHSFLVRGKLWLTSNRFRTESLLDK